MTDEARGQTGNSDVRADRSFPFVSYLRVYEPLDSFSEEQQLVIMAQRGRDRKDTERLERAESMRRITRPVSDPFPHHHQDLIRVIHYPAASGITTPFYCPNQLLVRTTLAAESLQQNIRGPLLDILLPDAAQSAHQHRIDPDAFADSLSKLHTRSATWGVPFGWFVLLQQEDHLEVVEEDGRVRTVRITAPLQLCIDRAKYAVASLAVAAPELDLLDELTELAEWLETFSSESIVELDYGLVADSVYPDDSPADVRIGIECLAEGDMTGAAAAYRRLASRWIPIRQLARAS